MMCVPVCRVKCTIDLGDDIRNLYWADIFYALTIPSTAANIVLTCAFAKRINEIHAFRGLGGTL